MDFWCLIDDHFDKGRVIKTEVHCGWVIILDSPDHAQKNRIAELNNLESAVDLCEDDRGSVDGFTRLRGLVPSPVWVPAVAVLFNDIDILPWNGFGARPFTDYLHAQFKE